MIREIGVIDPDPMARDLARIRGGKPIESFKKRVTSSPPPPPVINVIKNFPPLRLLIARKTPPRFSRIFSWSIDDLKTARSQGRIIKDS